MHPAISHSHYLGDLATRVEPSDPEALIAMATVAELPADLLTLKQRFFLSWSLASLSGAEYADLSRWQTDFAEATLSSALRMAWKERIDAPLEGLFVLGLGKLGGRDLNLSSDVDLVAFYDGATLPIPVHKGRAYETGRILKRMHAILQPPNAPEFVWRVDWRLRPEASVSGLAMDSEAARNFYFFRALPWHRLAMIKARPVAGDREAGDAFLRSLEPFLWRRNLDYRTLDDLAGLKRRINLEHPGLIAERAKPEPITDDPVGFNLKLGTGGIREIEFLANASQMIWGGKQAGLRTTNTLEAIGALGRLGHFNPGDVSELSRIYERFRRLENAVQMRGNFHTHILPEGTALEDVKVLAKDDLEGLSADRRFVQSRFSAMFHDAAEAPAQEFPRFVKALRDETGGIVRNWQNGFTRYGPRDTQGLEALPMELLWRISASGLDPEIAIERVDRFLGSLSRSEQYLRLLADHPELLDPLLTPLLHSPHMAELLDMSPHIIDVFLTPETSLDTSHVLANRDFEARLEALRRFVNEHLFLNYYELMTGRLDAPELQRALTDVAEAALEASLQVVADDLGLETLPVCVLGLGKIGTRKLMPLSDLDLLFLFPDDTESDTAAQIVRRLRTVLTARMSEGIVYELDMRLRPSGRSGPPAVKWAQFVEHHTRRARNWEHLALSTARVVAGDATLGAKAMGFVDKILTRPRDAEQLLSDSARMWSRIREQRIRNTPHRLFDARLREGGLLQAEFVANVLKLAGMGPQSLADPTRYFSDQLIWERLLGLTLKANVPERFEGSVPSGRTGMMATTVMQVTDDLFGDADVSGDDAPVIWT